MLKGTKGPFTYATDQETCHMIELLRQRQGDSRCLGQPGVPGVGRLESGGRRAPLALVVTRCADFSVTVYI